VSIRTPAPSSTVRRLLVACLLLLLGAAAAACGDDDDLADPPGPADQANGEAPEDATAQREEGADGESAAPTEEAVAPSRCEVAPVDVAPGDEDGPEPPPILSVVDLAVDDQEVSVRYTFDRPVDGDEPFDLLLDLAFLPGEDRDAGMGQLRMFSSEGGWTGGYAEPADPEDPAGTVLVPFPPEDGPAVSVDGPTVTTTYDRELAPDIEPPFEWAASASISWITEAGSVTQRPVGTCPNVPLGAGVAPEDLGDLPLYES
jgi:hypothetical protein